MKTIDNGVYLLYNTKSGYVIAYDDIEAASCALADTLDESYKFPGYSSRFNDWKLVKLAYGVGDNFDKPRNRIDPYEDCYRKENE